MSAFAPLLAELDRWHAAGRTAGLWLRDDDAAGPSAALHRLLAVTEAAAVPVALAVIPMQASASLAKHLPAAPLAAVWQHGVAHKNNALPCEKKQELVFAAPGILDGIRAAWQRLRALFPDHAAPVMVPPWNRIDPALIPRLPELGLEGLSAFKPRPSPQAAPGLWQVNTHVDVIAWREGARFAGARETCEAMAAHLALRRIGHADPSEPTGVLTHHLVMADEAWAFLSDLFALTKGHPAARWCLPNGNQHTGE